MSDVLTTHNLSKRYRKLVALDKLSLAVPEGSVYALLGANGAGKTTALKLMMNLHPATSGEATVLGIDSRQLQGRHFEQIGYVSENQDQPGWMTMSYLLSYLWEKYARYSEGQLPPAFNRRRWYAEWRRTNYCNEKLKQRLGWVPKVPSKEALRLYFKSCVQRGQHA